MHGVHLGKEYTFLRGLAHVCGVAHHLRTRGFFTEDALLPRLPRAAIIVNYKCTDHFLTSRTLNRSSNCWTGIWLSYVVLLIPAGYGGEAEAEWPRILPVLVGKRAIRPDPPVFGGKHSGRVVVSRHLLVVSYSEPQKVGTWV